MSNIKKIQDYGFEVYQEDYTHPEDKKTEIVLMQDMYYKNVCSYWVNENSLIAIADDNTVGAWQPKGTKEKRLCKQQY